MFLVQVLNSSSEVAYEVEVPEPNQWEIDALNEDIDRRNEDMKKLVEEMKLPSMQSWKPEPRLTAAQVALLYAAPEKCPYDCDHCRS